RSSSFLSCTVPPASEISTLSLHDALPILGNVDDRRFPGHQRGESPHLVQVDIRMVTQSPLHGSAGVVVLHAVADIGLKVATVALDRKSTRLNSSHVKISYAVFCLKKKKTE